MKSISAHAAILLALFAPALCLADSASDSAAAVAALKNYLQTPIEKRPPLDQQAFAKTPITKGDSELAQQLLWDAHVAQIKSTRAAELKDRVLTDDATKLKMPFFYTTFGEKPKNGHSLYISMHGGGNAPPALNDSQYENQKHLYKLTEGIYLAPRAPTNTWNLWHEDHIDRLFDRLIEDLIVLEGVDPNRIYLMGYSAGGDGVYQLAPRMADRFAAASMMAGHPNDASPAGLRNLPFTIHVGAIDDGFDRNKVAMEWEGKLADLRKNDLTGYIHWVKLHEGRPHWMNGEDAEALPWMAQFTRNPFPTKVVWRQGNAVHDRFYWLAVDQASAKKNAQVVATLAAQKITLETTDYEKVSVRLNDKMTNLDKPITITLGGKEIFQGTAPRTIATLAKTLSERGDPAAVFSAEIEVKK